MGEVLCSTLGGKKCPGTLEEHFCGGGCVKGQLKSKAWEALGAAPLSMRGCRGCVVLG